MIVLRKRPIGLLFIILATVLAGVLAVTVQRTPAHADSSITGLHVSGNHLLNGNNQTIRLLGVDRSGTEYKCANNAGIFDGPSDDASVAAMAAWNINVVRVPLNEDCWLGINGVQSAYGGSNYQQAIVNYVGLLNAHNIIPILDLHWTAPGSTLALKQVAMPDTDHSIAFWQQVADTFKGNSSVIFDLFNEPFPSSFQCWRDGSSAPSTDPCSDVNFQVAGMQSLVTAVRNEGANNVIMLTGTGYGNYIGQWLQYEPSDPQHNLIASAHVYDISGCKTTDCYTSQYAPVAAQVPLTFGELGETDCQHGFIDTAMNWADQNGVGYLGWAWDTYDCSSFPSLISDYNGTPTAFGQGFKDHFASLNSGGGSTPTPTPTSTPGGTTSFSTGFESGQSQPTWSDTVDNNGYPSGGSLDIAGIDSSANGPQAEVRNETAHGGSAALMYSGSATNGSGQDYAYMEVFDLSGQSITVDSNTTLTYWIYPQSSSSSSSVSGNNSTCVAIDLIFQNSNNNLSNLRDSGAVDQNGNRIHPNGQCGHLTLDTWNQVTVNLGAYSNGLKVIRLDVGYDQSNSTGGYRGYIDDISIQN